MFEIYDSHAHIYPNKIAHKASETIGNFYKQEMNADGSVEQLLLSGKKGGISRYVVHSVATTPHQVSSINRFIYEESSLHPEFIPFMTLHQDMTEEEIEKEVNLCVEKGFFGIKLHPDFQKFAINSNSAKKIYSIVGEKLPILFHTGDVRYDYSHPTYLAEIAKEFPYMRFIGAHFGGYSCWKEAPIAYKNLDNVWFDTSSSLGFIKNADFATTLLIDMGVDRFFFGSDYPMWSHEKEVERFMQLHLNDTQRTKIFSQNLKTFLSLN